MKDMEPLCLDLKITKMGSTKRVLISGASFAGLTTAFWMIKMGYNVTVVETSADLKKGGTPVDIKDQTVDIVKRMGLFGGNSKMQMTLQYGRCC
jgi:2-polyprenyl-6-methoxyphenol hydroxylase-like FAD-dependent oxidoreductase